MRNTPQFPTSTTKLVANTPPGVGADSSCPYPNITKMHIPITQNAYSHNQIRISPPHYVCVYVYADTINRPLQLLTAANYVANTLQNTQRTPTKWGANTPLGVGADSSCPYPNITQNAYSHYQIRVYSLSNMHIHIIKYVFSHYQIRISPPHFVCVYVYVGAINRPLQLLTACQLRGEHSANTQHPPTKCLTNTPSGVGADSSCPYPNIINYTCSHYQIRISPPHFVGVFIYAGAINRPLQLLTVCQLHGEHSANTQHPPTKCLTNTPPGVGGRFIVPVS